MDLGSLLERFWVDFGSKLGGKLGPSVYQDWRKGGTETMSKNHYKSEAAVVPRGMQEIGVQALKNTTSQGPQGPEGHTADIIYISYNICTYYRIYVLYIYIYILHVQSISDISYVLYHI